MPLIHRFIGAALLGVAAGVAGCSTEGDPSSRGGRSTTDVMSAAGDGAGSGGSAGGRVGSGGSDAPAGGIAGGPDGDYNVGHPCPNPGETRSCCEMGTQMCSRVSEFAAWGPCMAGDGQVIDCHLEDPGGCGVGEFAKSCDAGTPPPLPCGDGEFGPDCVDGGMPPLPPLCTDFTINNEPEILYAYDPTPPMSVGPSGQIKVWVTDECMPFIAPGEQIDPATGKITMPGDRTAKTSDGYLYEPALYIAPETAETGGTPHFPQVMKGQVNNNPILGFPCFGMPFAPPLGPPIDPPPPGMNPPEPFNAEYIWDVAALGLAPGTYTAEFVIHDGDQDRAVGCVEITIRSVD